jgi:hypothetical protein
MPSIRRTHGALKRTRIAHSGCFFVACSWATAKKATSAPHGPLEPGTQPQWGGGDGFARALLCWLFPVLHSLTKAKNRTLDEVEEGLRVDLVDAGLRLDRAKWLTYAEPAVRFAVTHMRDAQGLEPWAWGASVQIGG